MSLKPRQRPPKRTVIDMRALMEACADIHAADGCLRFLDGNESEYMVSATAVHQEPSSRWTMMPLSPKPVRLCSPRPKMSTMRCHCAVSAVSLGYVNSERLNTLFLHCLVQTCCPDLSPSKY